MCNHCSKMNNSFNSEALAGAAWVIKKIWLSMHPRNVGSGKIVRP